MWKCDTEGAVIKDTRNKLTNRESKSCSIKLTNALEVYEWTLARRERKEERAGSSEEIQKQKGI